MVFERTMPCNCSCKQHWLLLPCILAPCCTIPAMCWCHRKAYDQCNALFKIKRGEPLPAGMDPHDNTLQSTYTEDELLKMASTLLRSPEFKDHHTMSLLLFSSYSAGRGDDARERLLCELAEPVVRETIREWHGMAPVLAARAKPRLHDWVIVEPDASKSGYHNPRRGRPLVPSLCCNICSSRPLLIGALVRS